MGKWTSRGLWVIPFTLLVAGGCRPPVEIELERDKQINGSAQPLVVEFVTVYPKQIKADPRWDPETRRLDSKIYFEEHKDLVENNKLPPGQIEKLPLPGTDPDAKPIKVTLHVPLGDQIWDRPTIYVFGRFQNTQNAYISTLPVVLRDVLMLPRPIKIHVGKDALDYPPKSD